ncbi:MAG TPA: bifunctional ornithine acetyltransferase/N-acetylglutamate synthase, partial [Lacipirellulaceae bacterium]|nr:bifunctional ornithine acetyltransferase/N-acetylglutamate synthase [Lacipirellulaceae bacterium]
AAPVKIDRERTPSESIRVVAINSGVANACTGDQGDEDARQMAARAAESCGAEPEQALVMSTGVIGTMLPMEKIQAGIRAAAAHVAICRASTSPWSPVQALATPELIATTRIDSLGVRSRSIFTGDAHTKFLVYTPTPTAGRSETNRDRSSLLALRFTPQYTPAAR